MVGEVMAGLSAIKSAFDIAKGLKDIDDTARRNSAVIELQEKILAAQSALSALIQQVSDLEKEVIRLKAWDTDKQRYKLTEVGYGMTTYTPKEGMENGEPPHHLCANCYHDHFKSIMQPETRNPGECKVMVCHRCGSDLYISGAREAAHNKMQRTPTVNTN
jgi:hypothetical protein